MDANTYENIKGLLYREVKPALGCTEPVSVALCVARAVDAYYSTSAINRTDRVKRSKPVETGTTENAGDNPSYCQTEDANGTDTIKKITVYVCEGILKNAMGVGIPGTGQRGLSIAVAMAAVCGNWHYGLEVLKDSDSEAIMKAKEMVAQGKVCIKAEKTDKILYSRAECEFEGGGASVCVIEDEHDNITYLSSCGRVLLDKRQECIQECGKPDGKFLSLGMIYEFACNAALSDLGIIKEQIEMNTALSDEGLRGNYGLRVGKTIADPDNAKVFGGSLNSQCMSRTAAASDARMSGCTLPAMSNSGSGNQGLTVSLPVITTAGYLHSDEEQLIRALTLSNLVAIHIKSYLGRLSALCGCVVASTGAACGIVMLKGGGVEEMSSAIKNMVGNITGMICDGAKEGCALKVASGVSCAIQSAVLALRGICAQPTDGIIDSDIEKTIRNLGNIGSGGMKQANCLILDIMLCK